MVWLPWPRVLSLNGITMCAAMRNALDLALENTELGRINQIIGGIDRQKRRAEFFQVWPGIVIA